MRGLVILLHGVGSNGANMAPLGEAMAPGLPGVAFESPDAPFSSGRGREWFSVAGVTAANRPDRVLAARPAFDEVVYGLIEAHGLSTQLDRVALVGFSQGSIMAIDALASGRCPVGAIVAFSGRLASPAPLSPATGTPLLLIHGEADPIMPAAESAVASDRLRKFGVASKVVIEPGVGHQVSSRGISSAIQFLQNLWGDASQPDHAGRTVRIQ